MCVVYLDVVDKPWMAHLENNIHYWENEKSRRTATTMEDGLGSINSTSSKLTALPDNSDRSPAIRYYIHINIFLHFFFLFLTFFLFLSLFLSVLSLPIPTLSLLHLSFSLSFIFLLVEEVLGQIKDF